MTGLPTEPLRLAVAQARALPGHVAENARRAASLASHAARRDARVVLLPELHLCGYDLPGVPGATVNADDAGAVDDVRLLPLSDITGERDLTVLVGAAVREPGGALTNALLVVDAAGIRRAYTKQHLWHDEAAVFQDQVRDMLQPGTSALFLVVEQVTPDKAVAALARYGGTVLKSSLPKETEERLQEALHSGEATDEIVQDGKTEQDDETRAGNTTAVTSVP